MAIQGEILTLFKDTEKTQGVFPRTKVSAVSNEDGVGLDALLVDAICVGEDLTNTQTVPLNADTLGGRPSGYYTRPYNLLDNSDFRNPVNQRGATSYTEYTSKYTIDRWKTYGTITLNSGSIAFINGSTTEANNLYQYFPVGTIVAGKTYTAACLLADGTLLVGSGTAPSGTTKKLYTSTNIGLQIATNYNGLDHFAVRNETPSYEIDIAWVALYEGEYTAETLPPYYPKGYAHELLECQRYFCKITGQAVGTAHAYSTTGAYLNIPTPIQMRAVPSYDPSKIQIGTADYGDYFVAVTDITAKNVGATSFYGFAVTSGLTAGQNYAVWCNNLELSADL